MSRGDLANKMDAQEVFNWMAYEMSIDPDKHETYINEIKMERMKSMSLEQEAAAIKAMFAGLGALNGVNK